MILALAGFEEILPLLVFGGLVLGIWSVLSMISQRNRGMRQRPTHSASEEVQP